MIKVAFFGSTLHLHYVVQSVEESNINIAISTVNDL